MDKKYYKIAIIFALVILVINFIYLGYNEKHCDYNELYVETNAFITNKQVEIQDIVEQIDINEFRDKKKFRIKINFSYNIDDNVYTGYCYNYGTGDEYMDSYKYQILTRKYDFAKVVRIFYEKNKPYNNCLFLETVRTKWINMYYMISFIIFMQIFVVVFY